MRTHVRVGEKALQVRGEGGVRPAGQRLRQHEAQRLDRRRARRVGLPETSASSTRSPTGVDMRLKSSSTTELGTYSTLSALKRVPQEMCV